MRESIAVRGAANPLERGNATAPSFEVTPPKPKVCQAGHYGIIPAESLSGVIPVELGRLSSLAALNLTGNDLTGEIPENLSSLADLRELQLAGNQLGGCLPQTWRALDSSDLEETGLPFCE